MPSFLLVSQLRPWTLVIWFFDVRIWSHDWQILRVDKEDFFHFMRNLYWHECMGRSARSSTRRLISLAIAKSTFKTGNQCSYPATTGVGMWSHGDKANIPMTSEWKDKKASSPWWYYWVTKQISLEMFYLGAFYFMN